MILRFPTLLALALAIGAASVVVAGPAFAQDAKMEKRADRMTRAFERLDKNGDGVVDRGEVEQKLSRAFQRLDANGDGAIDRAEVEALRAQRVKRGKGKAAEKVVRRLQRLDENRDGKITQQEFMARTPRWFTRADENRDGRVTKAELEMFIDKRASKRKRD